MNYFKPKKGKTYELISSSLCQHFKPYNLIKPAIGFIEDGKVKQIIPYKEAPRAVKDKVKEIRKKWLTYRNLFVRPFVFQFRKIYLRLDGVQKKGESIYYMWTILYNCDPFHRNSTTITVRFEDFFINSR
ncbi:MAG: hypothetical protein ACFFDY_00270 [Candidatus Thorarchaeota archaeon]